MVYILHTKLFHDLNLLSLIGMHSDTTLAFLK